MRLQSLICLVLFPVFAVMTDAQVRRSLVIRNITVVDLSDGSMAHEQTVLIEGNRISDIGPADQISIPDDGEVVEASEKYLIPGLIDMHVHLFHHGSRRPPSTWAFPLFIANGLTGVREMWTEFASMPTVEQWRRGVARRFVREAALAGMDFVKVYSLAAPEVYRAILDEAKNVSIGFGRTAVNRIDV